MFIQLHVHDSKGSIRDAIAIPENITKRIVELGQSAYASTNHGSTSSLLTHYKLAKKYGVKFIFGIEAYITDNILIKERGDYKHICLFAKSLTGYKNILKLTTIAYEQGFYYKPRIDWNLLYDYSEGLIISSACLGGILGIKSADGSFDKQAIISQALKYKNQFNDNFYIEIQTNQMPEQIEFNKFLYDICQEYNIKPIATCDSHYVYKSEAWIHRQWNNIDDNDEAGYYQTDDFYLHSEDEVRDNLKYLPADFVESCIANTVEVSDRCNVTIPFGEDNFPIYKCDSQVETVKEICRKGWKEKIIPKIPKENRQVYLDRFNEEMDILQKANYLNMMLITWDYMIWGQNNGIRFGCGRGSVGASLVAYLMDITKVDPIRNKLTFSRFCNLARVTTADIDVDVEQRNRQRVIEYLKEKYGYVYQVRTFTSMAAKAALQKAGMCLGVPVSDIRNYSKQVIDDKKMPEIDKLNGIKITKENSELIKLAKAFVGIIANTSVHASAVLVFPKDPTEFCAIEKQGDSYVAAYDYHELEELGLAKIDVLGLKNMDIIQDTLDLLKNKGIELDLNNIPLADPKTAQLLCNAETDGVFQIESNMMKGIVRGIQPKCFDDLTAIVALGRPAPLQNGLVDEYIRIRKESLQ